MEIIINIALLLGVFYGGSVFSRAIRFFFPKLSKRIAYIISAICVIAMYIPCVFITNAWLIFVVYLGLSAILCDVIRLVLRFALKKHETAKQKADGILKCGIIPIVSAVIIIALGVVNMNNVICTQYTVKTAKNVGNGLRVALISDLHFGVSMDIEKLGQYCDEISAKNPDIVVLCGDITDEGTTLSQMQQVYEKLGKIKSTHGSFFVYGNHDRATYSSNKEYTPQELRRTIVNNGITVLTDKSVKIGNFLIVGREDVGLSHKSFSSNGKPRAETSQLVKDADSDDFILLLDHQPVGFDENVKAGVDLQLSGHTHNGQIFPIRQIISPIDPNEWQYGVKKIDNFTAIVSSGIAGWGFNIRTQGNSEYVIIDIVN